MATISRILAGCLDQQTSVGAGAGDVAVWAGASGADRHRHFKQPQYRGGSHVWVSLNPACVQPLLRVPGTTSQRFLPASGPCGRSESLQLRCRELRHKDLRLNSAAAQCCTQCEPPWAVRRNFCIVLWTLLDSALQASESSAPTMEQTELPQTYSRVPVTTLSGF